MMIRSLDEATQALRAFMPRNQTTDWNFALAEMRQMMTALGSPQNKVKAIHVAGTSGKTSTCYYIADLLHRADKRVGLTVSPHVNGVNDRVQINGLPLSEAEFCWLLTDFLALPAVKQYQPSYFGVMVGFAYWVFAQKELDYMVIEVGMGGRKDATNVIDNADKISVITDIGLDHTEFLGNDLATIAGEKVEIIQPHNQVFITNQPNVVLEVAQRKAMSVEAQLKIVEVADRPSESLPLFQQRNFTAARAVVDYLAQRDGFNIDPQQISQAANIQIPGRMEIKKLNGKTLVLDGAHNAQKMAALCSSMTQRFPDKAAVLVSFVEGKDISLQESMQALKPITSRLIITSFTAEQDVPKKAIKSQIIQQAALEAGISEVEVIDDPTKAFTRLLKMPDELLLVTGSFYLVSTIKLMAEVNHD